MMQEHLHLWLNQVPIEAIAGQSVLEAALAAGIYIPHLCSHPDLTPQGGCKLCVVELDGDSAQPVTACTTTVREGMHVVTHSDGLDRLRRTALEFVLAGHPKDCTGCRSYGSCELQAMMQYLSVTPARMRTIHKTTTAENTQNPLIDREMERCIQCGRCIRACQELRGVGILDYRKRDDEIYVGTAPGLSLSAADCRFCGACIEVCPTGALQDRVGLFRTDLPREQALIPCQAECPAHIDIPRYIRLIQNGDYAKAVAVIREKVPFPLALGHVCSHACETGCKHSGLGDAVSIRNLKRFAVEHDTEELWKNQIIRKPSTGKTVAVVGSGPAGLSAAYYLANCGHQVTVLERLAVPGGMMTTGIPEYRLPRTAVHSEIAEIQAAGVKIQTNCPITALSQLAEYDAVLVAAGAALGKSVPLPGHQLGCSTTAVALLRAVALGQELPPVSPGKRVLVLGGGNVAFDAARVARRLGAEVSVLCLEARAHMLADAEELEQAEAEGITICDGKSNLEILGAPNAITGLRIATVSSFRFEGGKLLVETVPNTEQVLPCDTIVFATGQKPDLTADFGLELNPFGYPICAEGGPCTSLPGVYVAGDVVTGTKSVIAAIEAGRRAASEIDLFLGGDGDLSPHPLEPDTPNPSIGKIEGFAELPRNLPGQLTPSQRLGCFAPVDLGLTDAQAHREAERCLQCDLRCNITRPKLWNSYENR